ncbi:glycosyltransferase [Dietzia massiliensis]|uniref:glycosyltransferase n=1 Tax=Dietzia massiliensis TaxID=2697499 RepID=UPI001F1F2E38|nr:glycosyltransferase [Dietzia massiliensis]MBS7548190.1 glycosyltransferase [Dietzia massiliensis]
MRRIDVAHITTAHSLLDNRIRRKECAGLVKRGYSVAIVGPGRAEESKAELEDGVQVVRLEPPRSGGRLARAVFGSMRVMRELLRTNPSAVHAHDPELIPVLIALRVLRPKIRTIYDAHEDLKAQITGKSYIRRNAQPIVTKLASLLLFLVERVVGNVVAATPAIAKTFPNAKNLCIVQNFPLLDEYPEPSDVNDFDTAIYVGRLSQIRGSRQIVEALDQLNGSVTLSVAGPLDAVTKQIIDHKPIGVSYEGVIGADQVPSFIAKGFAGLVLFQPHPNHIESQPTKLFEYMASGRPFIASNYPHWINLMGGEECGLFVDPLDAGQIANALQLLSSDKEMTRRLGSTGRRLIIEKFSFEPELATLSKFMTGLGIFPGAEQGVHEGSAE